MATRRAESAPGEAPLAAGLEAKEPVLADLARESELDALLTTWLAALARSVELEVAAVLLAEGRELRLAAGWGLDEADRPSLRLPLDEGFLGLVATTRSAQLALSAANDPQVRLEGFRRHGVRSVYGVPLLAGGDLAGVALLGSAHAYDFPERDKRVFEVSCRQLGPAAACVVARQRRVDELSTRGRLLATVAHDVRTPLSSIKIGSGALARDPGGDPDPAMVRRTAEIIERAAAKVERLTEDLFALLAIRDDPQLLARGSCDLVEIAERAVDDAQPLAAERGVAVLLDPIDAPPEVEVDPDRVRDVVDILVTAAIEDTARGGTVTLTVQERGPEVLMAVEDGGPGRSGDDLARMFEPGERSQGGSKRARPVGLALARAVVEAHGGRVWAASAEGVGTTVFATLPRASA